MPAYFSNKTFKFLRALARNNSREWFQAHKAEYEAHVREPVPAPDHRPAAGPARRSATTTAPTRAPVGGSLFRIHRDTRFANDKTPYKTRTPARASSTHRAAKWTRPRSTCTCSRAHCFVGAGLWHPEPDTQRRIRHFIADNPGAWKAAVHSPAFRRRFALGGESLVRPPRGFPADHPLIEDLKRKSFVASVALDDEVVLGPSLRRSVATHLAGLAPLVDYLCATLDLEF